METLLFALIASHNAHRQQKPVVPEPEQFQPFNLGAEILRGEQAKRVGGRHTCHKPHDVIR